MLRQKLLRTPPAVPVPPATGSVYTVGSNQVRVSGATGYNSLIAQLGTLTNWISTATEGDAGYYIKSDGTLWYTGDPGGSSSVLTGATTLTQAGSNSTWSQVCAGTTFAIALRSDGTLWSWGSNSYGATGQGTTTGFTAFAVQIGVATNWAVISCGTFNAYAIKKDGTLWAWGANNNYATGRGVNTGTTTTPTQIGTATDWAKLGRTGFYCGFAIKTGGTLWAWGAGTTYQLGTGSTSDVTAPTQIGSATDWISIANCNDGTTGATCGIRSSSGSNTLWSCGGNLNGGTGQGTVIGNTTSLTQVGSATNWAFVSGGSLYNISALKTDKTLWSWGWNVYGVTSQGTLLGVTSSPTQIGSAATWIQLSNGDSASIAIGSPFALTPGKLYVAGTNNNGQLGNGSTTTVTTIAQSGSVTTWVKIAGCRGGGISGAPNGLGFTLGIRSDGSLWAWGNNASGQLGIGNTTSQTSPVQVGSDQWIDVVAVTNGSNCFALGIKSTGTLWGWGSNNTYQLGTGNTTSSTSPVQVGSATTWVKISANAAYYIGFGGSEVNFAIGLQSNGTLWSWGAQGAGGATGQGATGGTTNSPTQIGTNTTWTDISCGSDSGFVQGPFSDGCYAIAVRSNGSLWAWGTNDCGQFGNGTTTSSSSPAQVGSGTNWQKVFAGSTACSFVINNSGQLYTCGLNLDGQTGLGISLGTNTTTLTQVGTGTNWIRVASAASAASYGSSGVVGIRAPGTMWTWGRNNAYNLGNGSTSPTTYTTPTQVGSTTTWTYASITGQSTTSFFELGLLAITV